MLEVTSSGKLLQNQRKAAIAGRKKAKKELEKRIAAKAPKPAYIRITAREAHRLRIIGGWGGLP